MKLETKRLIIRIPELTDAKDVAIGLNNKNISKYMMAMPFPYDVQMAKKFIKRSIDSSKENPIKKYDLVIELKSTKQVIGGIGLADIDYFRGIAGIGYWLNENYWKQGIMSEAVSTILKFAFNKLKMQRINLTCNAHNDGSKAIAKKFGFKLEGVIRKAHKPISTGKVADKYYYGLLKEDWKKSNK
jgi:ribosomal-protein-alanine N-acetyltransferase